MSWKPKFKKLDRVYPIGKTALGRTRGLESSAVWRRALTAKKGPFLVVSRIPQNEDEYQEYGLVEIGKPEGGCDYFHEMDIIPLSEVEGWEKEQLKNPKMPKDLGGIISFFPEVDEETLRKVYEAGYELGLEG
jgi:hypothetical protein